jgi:hypothetical protein
MILRMMVLTNKLNQIQHRNQKLESISNQYSEYQYPL